MRHALPDTIEHVTAIAGPPAAPGPDSRWDDVLNAWLRYSWLIALAALLCGGIAFAIARTMEPVYYADASVLIDRPNAGTLDNAADPTRYEADQRGAMVRSQLEILRSADLAAWVVGQLGLAESSMLNPKPGPFDSLRKTVMDAVAARFPQLAPAPQPAIQRQARLNEMYLERLSVQLSPDTYVVHVGFRATDPLLAARIANAHVGAYLSWLRFKRTGAIQGNEGWLAAEVDAARERVVAAEAAVRAANANGVLQNIEGRTALDQGLAQLSTDLAIAQANQVKAEARAAEVRRLKASGQIAGIITMSGSKLLDELQTSRAKWVAETAGLESSHGSDHPVTRRAEIRDSDIRAAIDAEVNHYVQGVEAEANIARVTVANLQTALEKVRRQVIDAEGGRSQLTRLEGVATTERTIYLALLQKLRSYDGVTKLVQPEATVLAEAQPPSSPRSPQPTLFGMFGGVIGAGLVACGIVWTRGRRNVVRHTHDATSLTGVPCLAIMPRLRLRRRDIDRTQPGYQFFREELRAFCAALVRGRLAEADRGRAVSLLVTSCLPGEGKTTFCHELGRFAAASGVRTLIVHADDRSHARVEPGDTPDEAITQIEAGLPLYGIEWVAPPTMLADQDLVAALETWRREFGLVVFDTPPATARAESLVLAPLVDATIVLARVDRTPRSLLAGVTAQIANAGGRLAGIVLTFVRLDTQRGMMPSDSGYWFNENRDYHHQAVAVRPPARV